MLFFESDAYSLSAAADLLEISKEELVGYIRMGAIQCCVFVPKGRGVSFRAVTPNSALLYLYEQGVQGRESVFEICDYTGSVRGMSIKLPDNLAKKMKEACDQQNNDEILDARRQRAISFLRSMDGYEDLGSFDMYGYYSVATRLVEHSLDSDHHVDINSSEVVTLGLEGLPFCSEGEIEELARKQCAQLPEKFNNTVLLCRDIGSFNSRIYVSKQEIQRIKRLNSEHKQRKSKTDSSKVELDPRERNTLLRIIKALALELEVDLDAPYSGAEVVAAIGDRHGVTVAKKIDTIAKALTKAKDV